MVYNVLWRNMLQSYQEHRSEPVLFSISALGCCTCATHHTGPTALRPIRRTKQRTHTLLIRNTLV